MKHKSISRRFTRLRKTLSTLLLGAALIAFWRGIWGILDIYLFPDHYELSSWLSLGIGVALLIATHHFRDEYL